MSKMVFNDLEPVTVEVEIKGKQYVLKEASASAAKTYNDVRSTGYRIKKGQLDGFTNAGELTVLLVSLCLFEVAADGKHKPVPRSFVESLTGKVVDALYKRAQEISALDVPAKKDDETPAEDEEPKNE